MNQRIWNGFTAILLTTALSTTSSCHAQPSNAVAEESQASHSAVGGGELNLSELNQPEANPRPQTPLASTPSNAQPLDAVKVGEYKSQATPPVAEEMIAKIQTHEVEGRRAATLYVRNIPVLTFIEPKPVNNSGQTRLDTKIGQAREGRSETNAQAQAATHSGSHNSSQQTQSGNSQNDPVWRAMAVAAKLNQLSRDQVDANTITVRWNGQQNATVAKQPSDNSQAHRDRYIIEVAGQNLVQIDGETRLPDTTRNLGEDALQATNRLRRLIGNAPPIREIAGRPALIKPEPVSLVTVRSRLRGWASWYGPGFHGNRSASGEIYNQNELTAAHRSLPFGTQVRVTNLSNNRSVIVRINDRGPYIGGRIIDLSAAAARVLGMMGSGVAPVSVEVLNQRQAATIDAQ